MFLCVGYGDGLEFGGEDGIPSNGDQAGVSALNGGGYPISAYRPDRPEKFSRKVFVGGLPPDIDEGT